jgi:prepilin-type N-terminal cleavage/methylation domain-containing protein
MNTRRPTHRHACIEPRAAAYSLVELLIVLVVIAILAVIALPMTASQPATLLASAARLMTSDIEFAQAASIAHADDARLIKLDAAEHRYWIAAASAPDTPLEYAPGQSTLVTFGEGRAAALAGVTIQSYDLDKDGETNDTALRFDMLGRPDQSTPATITLACQGSTITITIAAQTGEVTVSAP